MEAGFSRPSPSTDTGNIGFKAAESFLDKEKGLPNLVSMLEELGSGIFETSPAICRGRISQREFCQLASFEGASVSHSNRAKLNQGVSSRSVNYAAKRPLGSWVF